MNYDNQINYAAGLMEMQAPTPNSVGCMSLHRTLEQRLANAEREVERVKELLQLLDKNPDTQRILELLGR